MRGSRFIKMQHHRYENGSASREANHLLAPVLIPLSSSSKSLTARSSIEEMSARSGVSLSSTSVHVDAGYRGAVAVGIAESLYDEGIRQKNLFIFLLDYFKSLIPSLKMILPFKRKFGNRVTEVDGIRFDSDLEARRWRELQILERAREISDLKRQVNFPLIVNGTKVATIRPDFCYFEKDRFVIEDAKGFETPLWQLKWALLKVLYDNGITEFRIVTKKDVRR